MRYIDFLRNSPQAIEAQTYGVDGITYNKTAAGGYQIIDTPDAPFSRVLESIGGRQPPYPHMVTKIGYDLRWPSYFPPMVEALEQYYIDAFPFVAELSDEIATSNRYLPDVQTYVAEMRDKFITGQEPLANFDAYVARLKSIGGDQLLQIRQGQYDRFQTWMSQN